ncbi:hypothetical protein CTAYLR_003720 [Chrysophaeum taylorii]|uniref:Trichohyalin-plectin-homology domain-containing protein n=1 Tax=Chrysophaeum taylorii TaxID=2483200 RepID=A0AAD7UMB8_9STRA|nr:hypothetical protein CTAYLR_003720 [Chrysophaeum taylorii]
MTVISSRELERMRASVRPEAATATDSRRLLLKGLSDEKVKTWPNTLEAMRKKKENWKKEKIEEEEKARVEMDKEEAAFQMKQRLGAIERANLLLYEQTDRMKGLRSKQTYSEVVRERKEQAKEKQLRKRWESEKEREYHEALLKQIDQAERRDAGAEAARRAKAEAIADAQRAQLGEFRAKHIERLEAAKKDGELILKRAIADHEEDERLLEERRVASKIQQRMTLLANEALEERKREQRKEEERAEKARHADVAKKEYVASERERLEKARFDARQATKQRLIDKASNELATRINRDAERLERQVEELRQKEENLAALKVEMIRKQKAAIDAGK